MSKKDFSDLGYDLKKIAEDSMKAGDYNRLRNEVGNTVNSALELAFEEAKKAIGSINQEIRKATQGQQPNQGQQANQSQQPNQGQQATQRQQAASSQHSPQGQWSPQQGQPGNLKHQYKKGNSSMEIAHFPHKPVGKIQSFFYTAAGSSGIIGFGALILLFGVKMANPYLLGTLILGVAVSMGLNGKGSTMRKRLQRYKRYLQLCYGRDSVAISELATYTEQNERYVVKDLKKMIDVGIFPQGHIDKKGAVFMLTRERYQKYMEEQKEAELAQSISRESPQPEKKGEPTEHEVAMEVANMYIHQIHEAKEIIRDLDVVLKIQRMEDIVVKIFAYVKEHPDQLQDVRKFMQYYLPTTMKLLTSYQEFERQPIQGENIINAKQEIQNALDTINIAYENLFDQLFADTSMDISADISVLHTMMAQEGLMEDDFTISDNEGGKKQ